MVIHGLFPTLYESFRDINPAEWSQLANGPQDLPMDLRLLDTFQRNAADQCRCWGVLFRDPSGRPVAAVCLGLVQIDALSSIGNAAMKPVAFVRRLWPGCLRFRVLMCGLPAASGHSHLRIAPDADPDALAEPLNDVLQSLAKQHRASLIAIKELDGSQSQQLASLQRFGYLRGDVPPAYVLTHRFHSIDEYCRTQMGHYRRQSQRSMRKFQNAGFTALCYRGSDIPGRYDDALHALYEQIYQRSAYRFVHMPAEFFRALARQLGDQAFLTVLQRNGQSAAFVFSVLEGSAWYSLYCGLDYALNPEADLYFNLIYHDMDNAFRHGAACVHLGQTAELVKARMGATPRRLYFFTRARHAAMQSALRLFPMVFPPPFHPRPNVTYSKPLPLSIRHAVI